MLAALGIKLRFENTDLVTWMIPVLVLGLPVFDTTLVTLSRLRRGIAPYTAGKDHFSHRLVALGLTRREAVLVLYLIAVAFGMCSLFLLSASVEEAYFTAAVVAGVPASRPDPVWSAYPLAANRPGARSLTGAPSITMSISDKSANSTARVGVIGLGYVGLPLAVAFARTGMPLHRHRPGPGQGRRHPSRRELHSGRAGHRDPGLVGSGLLRATTDYAAVARLDVVFICVPTPYTPAKAPDISYIETPRPTASPPTCSPASSSSCRAPPTRAPPRKTCCRSWRRAASSAGVDFHLAFSPERVDPGNRAFTVANTPKVVGGLTPGCAELAARLLEQHHARTSASSPRRAPPS